VGFFDSSDERAVPGGWRYLFQQRIVLLGQLCLWRLRRSIGNSVHTQWRRVWLWLVGLLQRRS
jgi:hypothetical protein